MAIITLLISATCMAQDNYIVKTNGDTLHCKIRKVSKKGIFYQPIYNDAYPTWILNDAYLSYGDKIRKETYGYRIKEEYKSVTKTGTVQPCSSGRRARIGGAITFAGAALIGTGTGMILDSDGALPNHQAMRNLNLFGALTFVGGMTVLASSVVCSIKAKKQRKAQTTLNITGNGLSLSYKF